LTVPADKRCGTINPMPRHRMRNVSLGAITLALLAAAAIFLADFDPGQAGAASADPTVTATVGSRAISGPMPRGYVGASLEYSALHVYTGRDPNAINPVLVELLRNLAPGQNPVLRIGGNSADQTWWPISGVIPPPGIRYTLTPGWLRTTGALAQILDARLIIGVNLAGDRPDLAAAEAQALLSGIGSPYIAAFEIGNEPDVYNLFPWYRSQRGRVFFARSSSWSIDRFIHQFSLWRSALPNYPVTGPAFAELSWLNGLPKFIAAEPGLGVLTLHRYPLRACVQNPSAPGYATIPALLGDSSSSGLAQPLAPYAAYAHSKGIALRLDEMNSASCTGKRGVSDTFAAALWVLDTLFNMAAVGVDGVNVHSLPHAPYELFSFTHASSGWSAFVHPEYYGMLLFAQTFVPGSRLLATNVSQNGPLKVWAVRDPTFHTRVVIINKDLASSYDVNLQVSGFATQARLEWLQAPTASSTDGVTLGGQSFGDSTTSGVLPGPATQTVTPVLGHYSITLPPASAVVLTQ
jgi:hypothetical protein